MVIGMLIDGKSEAQVANELPLYWKVTPQAIHKFKVRHEADIESAREALKLQTRDVAITDSAERKRLYQQYLDELHEYQREYTLNDIREKFDLDGNIVQRERRFNSALVAQKRAILRDVAEEMGDISRAAKVQVNVATEVRVYDVGTAGTLPD